MWSVHVLVCGNRALPKRMQHIVYRWVSVAIVNTSAKTAMLKGPGVNSTEYYTTLSLRTKHYHIYDCNKMEHYDH